jgi:hypothetical protein
MSTAPHTMREKWIMASFSRIAVRGIKVSLQRQLKRISIGTTTVNGL